MTSKVTESVDFGSQKNGTAPRPRTVAIHTHGCKLNQADSQTLARQFNEAGFRVVHSVADADVVVLNSCTVTATADSKARQFLRATKRRNPDAIVVATGCYAQRSPAELENLDAVSLVVDNTAKSGLVQAVSPFLADSNPSGESQIPSDVGPAVRTRAMVKIQEGCDQVCAYCIVPKVRGRERSIAPERVIGEINRRASEGFKEVALTGTQLGTYGFDIPGLDLVRLLRRILDETAVQRVRVSSLQAHEFTGELLDLWADTRLLQHFHIPLQSGSNSVLSSMRRRYDTEQYRQAVRSVRSRFPDAGITTDVIVGFPGECEEDFSACLDFADRMRFSSIHAFPFSPRPGTSAFHFTDQVSEEDKRVRMAKMLALSEVSHRAFREAQLGSVRSVLWERKSRNNWWTGLTDNYIRVRTRTEMDLSNRITGAKLTSLDNDWVQAAVVDL